MQSGNASCAKVGLPFGMCSRNAFDPAAWTPPFASIRRSPNDFLAFFSRCRHIRALFFNGRKAETAFQRHVLPVVSEMLDETALITLPSTSPAYASLSRNEKLMRWKCILDYTAK